MLAQLQFADRPPKGTAPDGVCVAVIYGFAGREHMQMHLLRSLRLAGYANTTMYGHRQAQQIAAELEAAAAQRQRIAVIGYSQGGLEAVRVAQELSRRGLEIDLLVTIAAGGGGRLWPHRWADDPRTIPGNVKRCLNFFSATDMLGSDRLRERNLALVTSAKQHVENVCFERDERVSHLAISTTYPEGKVHPKVKVELLQRIQTELAALREVPDGMGGADRV